MLASLGDAPLTDPAFVYEPKYDGIRAIADDPGMAEALYVMEGDFINEGKEYLPGTSVHVKAGKQHGPHTTKHGCKVLVLWTDKAATGEADLSDFKIYQHA